jgi:hypothetical protein
VLKLFCFVNEGKTFSPVFESSSDLETVPATKKERERIKTEIKRERQKK